MEIGGRLRATESSHLQQLEIEMEEDPQSLRAMQPCQHLAVSPDVISDPHCCQMRPLGV